MLAMHGSSYDPQVLRSSSRASIPGAVPSFRGYVPYAIHDHDHDHDHEDDHDDHEDVDDDDDDDDDDNDVNMMMMRE